MSKSKSTLLFLLVLLPTLTVPAPFCPLGSVERRHKPHHPPPGAFLPPRHYGPRITLPPPPPEPIADESGYLGSKAPHAAPPPKSTPWRPDK